MSSAAPRAGASARLVLIEPYAYRTAGHWHHALIALAGAGVPVAVIVLNGISPATHAKLHEAGAIVMTRPPAPCVSGRALLALGRTVDGVARRLLRLTRGHPRWPNGIRRLPHQITMVSRCLVEAASLRTGLALSPEAPQVILTASETLHTAAAWAGGAPHLRIVHELFTREDPPLRALTATTRDHQSRVALVCPTPGVRETFSAVFPHLSSHVMPFALTAPGDYITDDERRDARTALPDDRPVAVLIGGWWPHKDPGTVIDAFADGPAHWRVIVAGSPLDETLLARWEPAAHLAVTVHERELDDLELRRLYAVADVTIVSRTCGSTASKESGLLMDAVRHGVPVLISDHDPALTQRLSTEPWARIFRSGDADNLADALNDLAAHPLPRPRPEDAAVLGLATPPQALQQLTEWHARLTPNSRSSPRWTNPSSSA